MLCLSNLTIFMLLVSGWFKGIQAFVCLSLIASIGTLLLALMYTFVHSVSKGLVLQLFIVASALADKTHTRTRARAHARTHICLFCVFAYTFLPVCVSTCRNLYVTAVYIYYIIRFVCGILYPLFTMPTTL